MGWLEMALAMHHSTQASLIKSALSCVGRSFLGLKNLLLLSLFSSNLQESPCCTFVMMDYQVCFLLVDAQNVFRRLFFSLRAWSHRWLSPALFSNHTVLSFSRMPTICKQLQSHHTFQAMFKLGGSICL